MELDERLLAAPPFALERSRQVAADMAETAAKALKEALACLRGGTLKLAASVRAKEEKTDRYEDLLSTYLVNLSARPISEADSMEAAKLLKMIGDFERIADHAVNLVEAAEELQSKGLKLTEAAAGELATLCTAIQDILGLSLAAFLENDLSAAAKVEPLEQVVDDLKEQLRTRHIRRLQKGACTLDAGFAWFDLLTDLERTADHCSNIAACVTDASHDTLNLHQSLRQTRRVSHYALGTRARKRKHPPGIPLCPGNTGKKEETPSGCPIMPWEHGQERGNMIYCVEDDESIQSLELYALQGAGFQAKGSSSWT